MKIVFLIRSLNYGGAERQLVALARGLHARGHDVIVAVFYANGPQEQDLRAAGVPIAILEKRGRWDTLGFLWRLARLLRRERPDMVHGYMGTSNALATLLKPIHRGKVVWGIRSSDLDLARYGWPNRVEARLERALVRFPDLMIANSRAGRDARLATGYPFERLIVIPNGIDADRFRPDPAARATLRAAWAIGDRTPLIGRIGRLDPQKDYPSFLRAAATVARSRSDARFVCIGRGPAETERELQALATALGIGERVLWPGPRDDMPAVFSALDLHVSSSAWGEGTPNVVAEAMACGVPCVVTDSGDSAWTVGATGRVVPPADPAALATAILATLDDLDRGAVDCLALRQRVLDEFSLTTLVDRTESALTRVINSPSPAQREGIEEGAAA